MDLDTVIRLFEWSAPPMVHRIYEISQEMQARGRRPPLAPDHAGYDKKAYEDLMDLNYQISEMHWTIIAALKEYSKSSREDSE